MELEEYYKKRKLKITSEPKGEISKENLNRFVVQKHQATHLHYDFRLEMEGVLKSWAVPKGLPEEREIKRLAIEVEPHPVDYINFKGVIPEGQYGAGIVEIFDKGKYELIEKSEKMIKFRLDGKKFKGDYVLLKMRDKNWLIYKI